MTAITRLAKWSLLRENLRVASRRAVELDESSRRWCAVMPLDADSGTELAEVELIGGRGRV